MRYKKPNGKVKTNCSKCNNELESHRIGKYRYCISCHNEYMRNTRAKHFELNDIQKKKANCTSYLNVYIKRGLIIKKSCEICNDINTQAHHDDYNKPLEVRWLCVKHHIEHHKSTCLIDNGNKKEIFSTR